MSEKIILNFRELEHLTKQDILDSRFLKWIIESYLASKPFKNDNFNVLPQLASLINKDESIKDYVTNLNEETREQILSIINDIYDYYRTKERYLIYIKDDSKENLSHREFVKKFMHFSNLVVDFYRDIYEGILNKEQTVYRILPSGGNVGIIFSKESLPLPQNYELLNKIPVLESIVNQPPFMIGTKQNTRKGFYHEKNEKIDISKLNLEDFYSVLIKINGKHGLIVTHKDYISFLASVGNLFEVTSFDESVDNVDFITLYGLKNVDDCYYYLDNNLLVGVLGDDYNIDYFGYMKKMILTEYNLLMIKEGNLPIHGAGFQIYDGKKTKNIVILGDSGAGKSETLEAVKTVYHGKYEIKPIFDDMGTFFLKENKVYTSGTEIGAFVRLDDLETSYSLNNIDRAIYFNIDKPNSRVVIPLLSYPDSIKKYEVHAFFIADNFSTDQNKLFIYDNIDESIETFKNAERVALNTTNEKGKVSTYFANPFGPMQEKEKVESFINNYFNALKNNNVPIGRILTSLSFDKENGPIEAAHSLINFFNNLD